MKAIGLTPHEIRSSNIKLMRLRLEALENICITSRHQGRIVAKSMRHLCSRLNSYVFEYDDNLTEDQDEALRIDAENFKRVLK